MFTEFVAIMYYKKTVIVTSFDENYIEYSKVMVKTLSDNYLSQDVLDLYCLVPDYLIDKEHTNKKSLSLNNINIFFKSSLKFKDLNVQKSEWFTKNAWHRIFISSVCLDYDRAIYIDPDCMVLRDISPLLTYPNHNPFIGLIQDDFSKHSQIAFGSPDIPYINDGVFITNLNFWRDNDVENKMITYIKENGQTKFIEQDVISIFMQPFVSPMPPTFNFFVDKLELYENTPNPMIVHFNGKNKPWLSGWDNKYHIMWKNIFNTLTYCE
jgi:lipopolysaccharide biosynthesis glycosyltransferase